MKKTTILMTALAVIFLTSSISARRGGMGGPPHDPVMHLNHLQQTVGLSDAQVEKLFTLSEKYRKQAFQNRKNPKKLYEIRESHRKDAMKVFTKAQLQKIKEMRGSRPGPGGNGRGCR